MVGHTNRINDFNRVEDFLYSSANDCTVRQWETRTGICLNIYKFADPISVTRVNLESKFMFTASWDKMIRVVDLEKQIIMKGFIASKETIKEMAFTDEWLIVAGVDPIIRGYRLADGEVKMFRGHKGWVYCLLIVGDYLYSGGDDNVVRIWNLKTTDQIEQLVGHRNGVTQIVMCNNMIVTGSFDHYVMTWDTD